MSPNEAIVALGAVAILCGMMVSIVGMWYKGRKNVGAQALASFENRLARLEVAMDDVTAELSRMTESHQLLTKALSDRQALPR
jgi:hypothetical protein